MIEIRMKGTKNIIIEDLLQLIILYFLKLKGMKRNNKEKIFFINSIKSKK